MEARTGGSFVLKRNAVQVTGTVGAAALVFAHGYGTSQVMWRDVASRFGADHSVVLFDLVGSGASDLGAYDRARYGSLRGYASDLIEILDALELDEVTYVGHSASAMIGVLAANQAPERFTRLVLVGGSACYVNHPDYVGGFERHDIDELLDSLEANYPAWARAMAPVVMATANRGDLDRELTASFVSADAEIARHFGRVTFLADHRSDVRAVSVPTLILQSTADPMVPLTAAQYLARSIRGSQLVEMQTTGHFPHMSDPAAIEHHLRPFLEVGRDAR
jgi:sigma-B regulation protein RsbQ